MSIDAKLIVEGDRNTKAYKQTIEVARNNLDKLNKNAKYNVDFLFKLVVKAEIIEDYFNTLYLEKNFEKENLEKISDLLKVIKKENKDFIFQCEFNDIFEQLNDYKFAIDTSLKEKLVEEKISIEKENPIKLVLKELNFKSPIFIQALRLAIFVMIATVAGNILVYFPRLSVADRGFWVPLTTAIVLFPEYVDTFSRGFERSLGTIIGAIVGFLLSLLPLGLLGHSIIVFILLAGYVAFRTSGQAWIMFWIELHGFVISEFLQM